MSDQNVSTRSQLYWNTLLKIPTQIITFVISIIVARILAPNDFGIMGIAMMLIGYSNLFTDFGFGEAIIQKGIRDNKTLNSIFTFNLAVSAVLALLFYASAGYIATFFKTAECENVIKVLSSVFIITSFSAVPYAVLRRDMNFKTLSLLSLNSSILMSASTLILALNNYGYWALAYGQLIPTVLITGYVCYRVRWLPVFTYNHSSMKHIIDFGVWNFLKTQLGFIAQHADRFIVGKWLGIINLGYYDKSLTIAQVPLQTLTANINSVMYSSFSSNQHKSDSIRIQFGKSLSLISFINFPIYFGLLSISPYFVHVLLGNQWVPMIIPFQIILIACIVSTFNGLIASLNIGMGNYKAHILLNVLSLAIFLICCFISLQYDLIGISIAYFLFMLTSNFLTLRLSMIKLALSWRWVFKSILPGLLGSLLMFTVLYVLAKFYFNVYSYSNMICLIVCGSVIYILYCVSDRSEHASEFRSKIVTDMSQLYKHAYAKRIR